MNDILFIAAIIVSVFGGVAIGVIATAAYLTCRMDDKGKEE